MGFPPPIYHIKGEGNDCHPDCWKHGGCYWSNAEQTMRDDIWRKVIAYKRAHVDLLLGEDVSTVKAYEEWVDALDALDARTTKYEMALRAILEAESPKDMFDIALEALK